jgi:hypothetical protein
VNRLKPLLCLLALFLLLGFAVQLQARIAGWEGIPAARHAVRILFAAALY